MHGMMKIKRQLIGVITIIVMIGAVGVMSIGAQSSLDDMLRIGFIGNSVDGNSSDGKLYQAAVLAAEAINDDDGVIAPDDTRYGFEIIFYEADTQAEVVDAYEEALNDDVIAILGPNDSTLAQALVDMATLEVPVLLGGSNAPDDTSIYPISSPYATWAEAAAHYLETERHFDRIGLLTVNTDNATSARDAFEVAVDSDVIVADITFDVDREEFSSEAETIRDEDAGALFIWARDEQMSALLEALDEARWDGVIVYGGNTGEFLQTTSADTGDVFGLTNWSATAYDAQSQAFVADYLARWDVLPSDDSAAYYDAISLIAGAVDNSGSGVQSINSWLNGTGSLAGVQGDYTGAQTDSVRLLHWQGEALIAAAQYAGGECLDCPEYFIEDTTETDVDDSSTFKIGLISAVNGDNQSLGEAIEDSVSLAIRDINAQGGVVDANNTRYTFSLEVYHASTADETEAALQEAAADGIQIVLGPDYNAQIMSNLSDAEGASILQFVSATNGQISQSESGDFVFQMRATDETLVRAAAEYLTSTRDLTRFVTVAVNTDYGVDSITAFEDGIADSDDGDILLQLEHEVTESDMNAIADQIVAVDTEVVAVWSTQPAAAALLTALESRGWAGVFVYGYLTPSFVAENPSATIEVLGPVNWWATAENWAGRDFSTRYSDRYNDEPFPQTVAYYDTVYLVRQAISDNGAGVDEIQSWLLEQDSYIGVQGEYTPEASANGELSQSVLIVSVDNGIVREVSRYTGDVCVAYCE